MQGRSVCRRVIAAGLALQGFLAIGTRSGLAQQSNEGSDGGALGDIIVWALQELLRVLFSPIRAVIETHGDAVLQAAVGTPHPDAVFHRPTNAAWPEIYDFYWETMIPLTLSLYGLSIGLVIFLESTSHLFSSYHHSKLKKRAFTGLLGILSWWWIVALSLRFTAAMTEFLTPSLSELSLFQTLSFSGMGVLGMVVALTANLILVILIGLIYLARHLVLYLFVLLMPLLVVFWIPGVGPFTLMSTFMRKLAGFFVPFLFMTVPVVLLFRLSDLLGTSVGLSAGEFGAWLTALVLPLLAVLSPLILFWQAGALFFIADHTSSHLSAQQARRRIGTGREHLQTATHGGENFVRAMRDEPAITRSGQTVFDSGDSRAHASGQRLAETSSHFGALFQSGGDQSGRGGSSGSDSDVTSRSIAGSSKNEYENGRNETYTETDRHTNMRQTSPEHRRESRNPNESGTPGDRQ